MSASTLYAGFQTLAVIAIVAVCAWRVWRTYAPRRTSAASREPGCDAGCPSCNHCSTPAPPGPREQPLQFHPRAKPR